MKIAGFRALFEAVQLLTAGLRRRFQALRFRPAAALGEKRRRSLRQRGARFEQLERREVFDAGPTFHGGTILPHVEVQGVYLGSDWSNVATEAAVQSSLDSYLSYLVQSPFMDMLTDHDYNVGQGTASKGAVLPVTLNKTSTATGGVSDATIQADLQAAISLKLIDQPTLNKVYAVFVEQGVVIHDGTATSATTFAGYHGAFAGTDVNNIPFDIHYAVLAYPSDTAVSGFNPTAAQIGIGNEFQQLALGGSTGGSIKPTFGTGTSEVQALTVGGTDGGMVQLAFNGVQGTVATELTIQAGVMPTKTDVLNHLNSIPALNGNVQVTGSDGGPFTITFTSALAHQDVPLLTATLAGGATAAIVTQTPGAAPSTATTSITRTDEVQTLAVGGTDGGTMRLGYQGSAGSVATQLTVQSATPVTAIDVLNQLNSIPALTNNVTVAGNDGGPFTITFFKGLTGVDVDQLVAITDNGATATIGTQTNGSPPTAAQVLASINSIAGLTNNVSVSGIDGGPFTIAIRNLGNIAQLGVTQVSGGLTGSFTTLADGEDTLTADFDQLTYGSSHEIAETITDGDVNYKSLGWYDDTHNVEIADLTVPTLADQFAAGTRLNGYLVTRLFAPDHSVVAADTTSTAFPLQIAADGIHLTTALQNVTVTRLSLSRAQVSWTPVAGAVGYRVFLVNGTTSALLSRVTGSQTSTILSGLPQLQSLTFRVEAYNAVNITDPVTVSMTLPLPNVTAPQHVVASKNPASNTSAILTWNASPGAAGYRVYLVSGSRKTLFASVSEASTTVTINGLTAGSTVSFKVEAFRGSRIADSAVASVTLNKPSLAAPVVSIQAVGGNLSLVQLNWSAVSGAKGYRVYYLNSAGKRVLLSTVAATGTTTKISGLPAHTSFIVEAFSGTLKAASKAVKL